MSRYIYQVHIADGFVDDCEELIHRCSKVETLTYEKFCEIWKDMNFASIYQGRTLGAEIAELSEEVIFIAKRYMMANTSNFEESVAGLFLVYGLLNVQPFPGFAALRLVPDDMPAIIRIQQVARRDRRLDVLYTLGSVLIHGPTQCHAMLREHGLEPALRKYIEGWTGIDKLGIRPKGVFYRQNEELDMIRELSNLNRLYSDAKAKITDEKGEMDRNLNYTDKNFPKELDMSLKKIINGIINKEDDQSEHHEEYDHSTSIKAIKAKAMSNIVDPMKHLTGLKERKNKGKNAYETETLSQLSSSKKRKRRPKTYVNSKKKKLSRSSSESGEDLALTASDDDDDDKKELKTDDLNIDNSKFEDLHCILSNCDPINNTEEKDKEDIEKDDPDEIYDQEIDIEIDSVPVVIRSEQSELFEIEIIDHCADKKPDDEKVPSDDDDKKKKSAKHKIEELPGVTLKKVDECSNETPEKIIRTKATMAKISKVPNDDDELFKMPKDFKLKKRDKRDLKKPILKSKFKKMGLQSVANFADKRNRLETCTETSSTDPE